MSKKLEIVLVDDGSKDDSLAIARSFAGQFQNVQYCELRPNRGMCRALLAGFAVAKGEYATLLPADGQIAPRELAKLLPFAGRADLVLTDYAEEKRGALRWATSRVFAALLRGALGMQYTYRGIFLARTVDLRRISIHSDSFLGNFEIVNAVASLYPRLIMKRVLIDCSPRIAGMSRTATLGGYLRLGRELRRLRRARSKSL